MESKSTSILYSIMLSVAGCTRWRICLLLWSCVCLGNLHAQEISIPSSSEHIFSEVNCDDIIFTGRELYNKGELAEIITLLEPCTHAEDLATRQRRSLYRLLAESHLYLREYPAASEYARQLAEIDPKLQVYGLSRMRTSHNKLRTAIQSSKYVDAPDLLLLVGKIRYRAIGIELFGGYAIDIYSVKEQRYAPGVSQVDNIDWEGANRANVGIGVKYDPYRFPLSISMRLSRYVASFSYSERQVMDGRYAELTLYEKQQWITPEVWLGYQFAAKTFPIKTLDVSIRAGLGMEILTGSALQPAFLRREEGADWYSGDHSEIYNEISQKTYLSALAALTTEYRFGRQSVFAEVQYRRPFIDKYIYDIELAPYSSDVRSVYNIGLQIGVRYVFYKAFFK